MSDIQKAVAPILIDLVRPGKAMPWMPSSRPTSTSWAQAARDALASTAELTAGAPETLAKLLLYKARDTEVSPFTLLVQVKAHCRPGGQPARRLERRSHRHGRHLTGLC